MTTKKITEVQAATSANVAPLAEALGADKSVDGGIVIVVASFSPQDVDTAARLLSKTPLALVAAQVPPNFPFAERLRERAEATWERHAVLIPPLSDSDNIAAAADAIAAVLASFDNLSAESAVTPKPSANPKFGAGNPEQAAAKARKALKDVL